MAEFRAAGRDHPFAQVLRGTKAGPLSKHVTLERAWGACGWGVFLCSREAARDMVPRRTAAILFTGATSLVRGRKGAVDFSSAKFGLRGLAESLARELWPKGIHVAHVVLDGMIDTPAVRTEYHPTEGEPLPDPEGIADAY